ncbi:MAG TPA: hypothetical protein VN577_05470 [Terriglobales bacterium]|nr:hypothetical protein [Terriglobales bacterium]
MLRKCVNPFCNRPFRYLSQGKLFVVEFPRRAIDHLSHRIAGREHFWLCEECAKFMTIAVRREFDSVAVKIINLPVSGATKLKFIPPKATQQTEPVFVQVAEPTMAQTA